MVNWSGTQPLRYHCTPNDHHSSAQLYGRTVDPNPTKVYIFWKLIVDYDGLFTKRKKFKVSQI